MTSNTSSFIIKGSRIVNTACFASIANALPNIESSYIIIEEAKQQFGLEGSLLYLERLREAGIKIGKVEIVEKEIHVYFDTIKRSEVIIVGMAVRFLWEGLKNPKEYDQFNIIARHFMNLCDFYPEKDKMVLLTFAHNLFSAPAYDKSGTKYFNHNHAFSNGISYCKIVTVEELSNIPKDQNVNDFFNIKAEDDNGMFKVKDERDRYNTKEDYDGAIAYFNKHNKSIQI